MTRASQATFVAWLRWIGLSSKRTQTTPSRQNAAMRDACSALVRAPVSIFALTASTLRSGRPTHSRQPTVIGVLERRRASMGVVVSDIAGSKAEALHVAHGLSRW